MIDEKKLIEDVKEWGKEREIKWTSESVISLLESVPKIGEWIPCSKPPKHTNEVLIFNGKSYSIGYYDGKTWINAIHPVEWQEINHESQQND